MTQQRNNYEYSTNVHLLTGTRTVLVDKWLVLQNNVER